ncbi:hypothetical protein HPB48_018121 [Haemaphysalis longicornis]|uniref:Ran GTPase-activating protein n=1 Tax=Haemaphysalis longicornis TaxID=44386 RepID=A0A9J6FLD3_HAELO|nr:hypothetical protein HPB48_018121 [Haemaphysalis longicornis]
MDGEDRTCDALATFESFVDQLPRDFRRTRELLKNQWLRLAKEGLDLSRPCTGGDVAPCWLNDHIYTLNAILHNAGLHISMNGSSALSIAADSLALASFSYWEEVLFAHLVAGWIVAHHRCLRELGLSFPGPEYLRLLGVRRLEASGVPGALIVNAIQNGALLESIKICQMPDSQYCVDHLAVALRGSDRLKRLELKDNYFESGSLGKLLEAVSGCRKLEALAVHTGKVSPEDVQALRSLLNGSRHLKKLSWTQEDGESITAAINDLQKNRCLEELHTSVLTHPEEAFSLSFTGGFEDLRVLSLQHCGVKSECAVGIAKHLVGNTCLKEVDLSANDIGEEGALALAEALRQNRSLEKLDISGNQLGSSALLAFAEALNQNTRLKKLRFDKIYLSDEKGDQVFEGDRFKGLFKRVYIVWSERRLGELCKILLADQHHPKLSLEFDGDLTSAAIDALFSALSLNSTVTKLCLYSRVDLPPAFAERLADFLKRNESVRCVDLMRVLSEEFTLDILEALRHNKTVSYYRGRTDVITPAIASAVRHLLCVNDSLNELILCDCFNVEAKILDVILQGLRNNPTLLNLETTWETVETQAVPEIRELLRRNRALVTLAARYVSGAAAGADAAKALKTVHRSYALVKELVEMTGESKEYAREDIAIALAGLSAS